MFKILSIFFLALLLNAPSVWSKEIIYSCPTVAELKEHLKNKNSLELGQVLSKIDSKNKNTLIQLHSIGLRSDTDAKQGYRFFCKYSAKKGPKIISWHINANQKDLSIPNAFTSGWPKTCSIRVSSNSDNRDEKKTAETCVIIVS